MWSVTASPLLPGVGYTKTPTCSLKEIVESFFLEKKSGGGEKQGFPPPPSGEIPQNFRLCPGLVKFLEKILKRSDLGGVCCVAEFQKLTPPKKFGVYQNFARIFL